MTHDLVERLRWWGAKRKPPRGMEAVPLDCREAADRIETYMADADAHVSRLDLVRRQEDEIRDLKAENAALRAERDSAFAMSTCECGADEACANLARLRAEKAELRKATIEEAAAICERQAKYFRDLSNDPSCLSDIRWNSREQACHTMQSYAERHEVDAAAIRNMGERE